MTNIPYTTNEISNILTNSQSEYNLKYNPINSDCGDPEEQLKNLIKNAEHEITVLNAEIEKYNERIAGWKLGLNAIKEFEDYRLNVEFANLSIYEKQYTDGQYKLFIETRTKCPHLDVQVYEDSFEIECCDCNKSISSRVVNKDAKITYIGYAWDEYGNTEQYDEIVDYEWFKERYIDPLDENTCYHEELTTFRIHYLDYSYDVNVCVYCGKIVNRHNVACNNKTQKYIDENKEE